MDNFMQIYFHSYDNCIKLLFVRSLYTSGGRKWKRKEGKEVADAKNFVVTIFCLTSPPPVKIRYRGQTSTGN